MKKLLIPIVFALSLAASLVTAQTTHATPLSEDQVGLISMTCGSIQLQLKNLQKTDSRIRVFLGSKYEFILTNLITNLNLRLIRHNLASSPLTASQATFSSERDFFKAAFTDYAKSLDTLIATDCTGKPQLFYDRLEVTREKRETVRQSYLRLKDVLVEHRAIVTSLKDTL